MDLIFREETEHCTLTGRLSPDRLKLFLDQGRMPSKTIPSRADIINALARHMDRKLVDDRVIDDIVRQLHLGQHSVLQRRISAGEAPFPGVDGRFEVLAKPYMGVPEIRGDGPGKLVFADLHLFDNIEKGAVVVRIHDGQKTENFA